MLTLAGVVVGTVGLYVGLYLARPYIDHTYGLSLAIDPPRPDEWLKLALIVAAGFVAACYRLSGLTGCRLRTA